MIDRCHHLDPRRNDSPAMYQLPVTIDHLSAQCTSRYAATDKVVLVGRGTDPSRRSIVACDK
jgi:hypothetical protein